jgi:hypothetical protein
VLYYVRELSPKGLGESTKVVRENCEEAFQDRLQIPDASIPIGPLCVSNPASRLLPT